MARIVGVDLPKNKRGEIGLTYIYGIGRSTARKILEALASATTSKSRIGRTTRSVRSVRRSLTWVSKSRANAVRPSSSTSSV